MVVGADHVADLAQHLNTRRKKKPVVVNDDYEFPRKQGGFFVGKLQIHVGNYDPIGESVKGPTCLFLLKLRPEFPRQPSVRNRSPLEILINPSLPIRPAVLRFSQSK